MPPPSPSLPPSMFGYSGSSSYSCYLPHSTLSTKKSSRVRPRHTFLFLGLSVGFQLEGRGSRLSRKFDFALRFSSEGFGKNLMPKLRGPARVLFFGARWRREKCLGLLFGLFSFFQVFSEVEKLKINSSGTDVST